MTRVPAFVRTATVVAWLAAGVGAGQATEMPAYAPIQTEREVAFASTTLGLKDRIAALQAKATDVMRIEYAMLDLDTDGEKELFIRIVSGADCSPGSCTTMIFNMAGGTWVKVLETDETDVTVAKQVHRGYRDIIVGSQPWLWTGKAYAAIR